MPIRDLLLNENYRAPNSTQWTNVRSISPPPFCLLLFSHMLASEVEGVENPLQNEVFVTGGSLLREKALKYLESPPTPKNILDNLVTVHFAQVGGGERCPVCGEEYEQGGPVKKLPCGDIFHLKCIYPWLEFHNTCPLCLEVFIDRER